MSKGLSASCPSTATHDEAGATGRDRLVATRMRTLDRTVAAVPARHKPSTLSDGNVESGARQAAELEWHDPVSQFIRGGMSAPKAIVAAHLILDFHIVEPDHCPAS